MRLLISHKLFLALLTAITLVILVALLLTRWSFNHGFLDYVIAVEAERIADVSVSLQEIYAETGSWDALLQSPVRWRSLMRAYTDVGSEPIPPPDFNRPSGQQRPDRPPGPKRELPPDKRGGPQPGVRQPLDLLDENQQLLIGKEKKRDGAQLAPIEYAGKVVGYLRYIPISELTDLNNAAEQQFIAQQRSALAISAGIALLSAALLAFLFGQRLTRPIKALLKGTKELAAGQLARPVEANSQDELGQLALSFNRMAASLTKAQQSQQQWLADIAHGLRTPLTILTGELQAIEDGVRQWSPETRESLQAEIERLNLLVNDLREVSLADAGGMDYQRHEIDFRTVIDSALSSYSNRLAECGLKLETDLPVGVIPVTGDARRLQQVITNLLENSCRYTHRGGTVRLSCKLANNIELVIADSAPAAPTDALPRLFDRLFRAEESRNRGHGGSGLGLAICKGIVEAHGGQISAAPSLLGGLAIKVQLPRDNA